MKRNDLRNVAIIAHVDHGKTTLVDQMLKQSGQFRESELRETCILDSNPLERERGITILAKNIALQVGGTKINIIDTPGHADFGGEVERVLKMADGALLLADAPLQMLIVTLDHSDYVGRIGIGRVVAGKIKKGQRVALLKRDGSRVDDQVTQLHIFDRLGRAEADEVAAGDICAVVGLESVD